MGAARLKRFLRPVALVAAAALALAGCNRENRNLGASPAESGPHGVVVSQLFPGPSPTPTPTDPRGLQYESNATHLSNGARYFEQFNCVGCHFHGGGGIGPALMDNKWRYGGSIEQIYASIAQGRPNGMPAFGAKIPPEQIWELAAYVRSLSGQANRLAVSSRMDEMRSTPPTNHMKPQPQAGDAAATTAGPG
jgi:cytochrome c oxidase cbb3-type subunit 3